MNGENLFRVLNTDLLESKHFRFINNILLYNYKLYKINLHL